MSAKIKYKYMSRYLLKNNFFIYPGFLKKIKYTRKGTDQKNRHNMKPLKSELNISWKAEANETSCAKITRNIFKRSYFKQFFVFIVTT